MLGKMYHADAVGPLLVPEQASNICPNFISSNSGMRYIYKKKKYIFEQMKIMAV